MRIACELAMSATRTAWWRSCRKTSAPGACGISASRGDTSTVSTMSLVSSSLIAAALAVRQDAADRVDELERPERLGEVLRRAGREPDRAVTVALVRGEHHDGNVLGGLVSLDLAAHVETVGAGPHVDVQEDEVGLLRADEVERLVAVLRFDDGPPLRGQGDADHLTDGHEVVGHE